MAGILAEHVDNWFNLTSDQTVLDVVSGYKIPFIHPPFQLALPNVPSLSPRDHLDCINEINKLLDKQIISPCTPTEDQFISSFFLVDKPNCSKSFILNLKALNKFIIAPHFKLEDSKTVLRLVSKSCWMATIDLQDAYFTIKIDKNYKKFLRFKFEDTLYEFNCLPFGLCTAPFIFTKIMKPVVHYLRSQGYQSVNYLDDFSLLADSFNKLQDNLISTIDLLESLGF